MEIAIDKGHNWPPDTGAAGIRKEDDCTKEIGNLVISKLKALGHTVIDVTPSSASSVGESLSKRVNTSNNSNVDLYISIHMNSFNGIAKGTEVFYYPKSIKGKDYAQKILSELIKLGFYNRGIKDGSSLYVIKSTKASSILVECCFIDNKEDMNKYNAENIANAIVKGITGKVVLANTNTENNKIYRVQLGAFTNRSNAEALLKELQGKGYQSYIKEE